MIQLTITGTNKAELLADIEKVKAFFITDSPDPLSASDKSRLRGDATVVAPQTAKEKKAAEKAAAAAAAAESETEVEDDDELDTSTEEMTVDDLKTLLLEAKASKPNDATVIKTLVGKVGASKLSEVKPEDFAKVAAAARAFIANKQ
jgi:AMMECR1 domain-containing protein